MSVCEIDRTAGAAPALLPVALDVSRLRVAVVGRALGALRRLDRLDAAQARRVKVFADRAAGILQVRAGERLVGHLPTTAELEQVDVLFLTDLGAAEARPLADRAHAAGVLVHVEDGRGRSDFLPVDGEPAGSAARPPATLAPDPLWGLPAHIWGF